MTDIETLQNLRQKLDDLKIKKQESKFHLQKAEEELEKLEKEVDEKFGIKPEELKDLSEKFKIEADILLKNIKILLEGQPNE